MIACAKVGLFRDLYNKKTQQRVIAKEPKRLRESRCLRLFNQRLLVGSILICLLLMSPGMSDPIRLHPDNPHYFEYQGKALALITSAEHYGAVINLDFDFIKYLDTLQAEGMNYTRIFSGTYVEPPGAFTIRRNTLAPAPGRFQAPWQRTMTSKTTASGGEKQFNLTRYEREYMLRLMHFVHAAYQRSIIVELTLFSSTYSPKQWAIHPFNRKNNVNDSRINNYRSLHTLSNGGILDYQKAFVALVVRELNTFDNLFYEIQNEPWSDNHSIGDKINPYLEDKDSFPNVTEITTEASIRWQRAIAQVIVEEESKQKKQHLIAQNIANFRLPIRDSDLVPEASILNFHYAYGEAVTWNYGLDKLIGCDETGFAGRSDDVYRNQAWEFVLAGGGLFNNLDYSFTVEKEDGTDTRPNGPGGGSPKLRKQLKVLSEFIHSFKLEKLKPDYQTVKRSPGVVCRVLSEPGRQYALYIQGRAPCTLDLDLPTGYYRSEWINPITGRVSGRADFNQFKAIKTLNSPMFKEAIVLRINRN
jgi:hypothetical protein